MVKHGHVIGGHGLAQIMARPLALTCGMSDMVQISCTSGCTGLCAFCKESNSARSLNAASLFYHTDEVQLSYNGKTIVLNSDTKVMAYDQQTDSLVSLPIRNALKFKMPIFKRHLQWLIEKNPLSIRVLSD